ncbi:MAG TPA: hypothetical protein VJH75_02425 [Patescibacteria group bacterium]|nr:hypothetical protein [Patescibacteria group bacterium]
MYREPTYREALGNAWRLTWRHPLVWIFGLLSIIIGQFGLSDFVGKLSVLYNQGFVGESFWAWPADWSLRVLGSGWEILSLVLNLLVLIALIAIIIVAGVGSQGALVAISAHWYVKKKIFDTEAAWHHGIRHFWPLLLNNILAKGITILILLALVYLNSYVLVGSGGGSAVLFGFGFAIALFLVLVVNSLAVYTAGYIVTENFRYGEALRAAGEIFRHHILVSLELSLIMVFLNILLVALIVFGSFVLIIPSVILWVIAGLTGGTVLITAGIVLAVLLFILFIIWIGTLFNVFNTSAWIYLFMKLKHVGAVSKMSHWVERIIARE